MFITPEAIDIQKHAALRFQPVDHYAFAETLTVAPISAFEVTEAGKYYPLIFPTEGPPTLLALFSLNTQGRNHFIDANGQWTVPYVPAHVRRYPFALGGTEPKAQRMVLMLDRAAPHFQGDGELLFTADDKLGPTLEKALNFLKNFQQHMLTTEKLLQPLQETGILVQRRMELKRQGQVIGQTPAFRTVDPKKLSELDDATLAGWVRNGLLAVIYAHLHSLSNVQALADTVAPTE